MVPASSPTRTHIAPSSCTNGCTASRPWLRTATTREGFLLSGHDQQSECVAGDVLTGDYLPGGYFYRPADATYGGPASIALEESVWLLRETGPGSEDIVPGCAP